MVMFTFISYNNIVDIIWCLFHMLTDRTPTMRAAIITPAQVCSESNLIKTTPSKTGHISRTS